jgi:hypothetical protein
MPRKKPFSAKKRKVQLQEARAIQRGEFQPDPESKNGKLRAGGGRGPGVKSQFQKSLPVSDVTRRLQSRFIQVSPEYLERTRNLAYSVHLERPIPSSRAVFDVDTVERGHELRCPSRPKFRYDQTKKELERNEEAWFEKWLRSTEEVMREYVAGVDEDEEATGKEQSEDGDGANHDEDSMKKVAWPRSGSWYETNLEVWRQL